MNLRNDPPVPRPGVLTPADMRPEFLITLGLVPPVSIRDVEEAYRAKSKTEHPDRGGSSERFVALQKAYERAMEYARFLASRRDWLAAQMDQYIVLQEFLAGLQNRGGSAEMAGIEWLDQDIGQDFAQILERVVGIRLSGLPSGDEAVEYLLENRKLLTGLHSLDLSSSQVYDGSVLRLFVFRALRMLDLRNTPVTNEGLQVLEGLTHLKKVFVAGTKTSWLGLIKLRSAHPSVTIDSREPTGS